MKKLIYALAIALVFVSCEEKAPKDYVTISGTLLNKKPGLDSLFIIKTPYKKGIKVEKDGTFSDTLKAEADKYFFYYETSFDQMSPIYIKDGYDLQINFDNKDFINTLTFTGKGAEASTYLTKMQKKVIHLIKNPIDNLEPEAFEQKLTAFIDNLNHLLENTKGLDETLISLQTEEIQRIENLNKKLYRKDEYMATSLAKGKPSPKFVNYENYAGGTTSLDDFKGKFVYIDMWATTCIPCIKEFPFLKKLEQEYHDKNIEFVSISTDTPKRYERWRAMVAEKELSGIQLYDKNDLKFTNAYKIVLIPRFILVDPEGNIVSADAPKPSDKKLISLFEEAGI